MKARSGLLCVGMAVLFMSGGALGQDQEDLGLILEPEYNYNENNLTILGISLSRGYSIEQVREIMGNAQAVTMLKSHEPDRLCYTSDKDQLTLVFGFQWGQVTEFWLYSSPDKLTFKQSCLIIPNISRKTAIANGVSIRLNRQQIRELGIPSQENEDTIRYQYDFQSNVADKMARSPTFSWSGGSNKIIITIKYTFEFNKNSLESIWVSRTSEKW